MCKIVECDKNRQRFYGFRLKVGYLFGYDEKGRFVCPRVRSRNDKTIMLWREDKNAGWREVWENSATTQELYLKGKFHNVVRNYEGNALSQVPRKHRMVKVFH